ncbi:hypothetical protein D5F01_LYC24924 [Larimichthys crocea]|uniref:DUF6729 domain-containing protein n=1 Tax=Larimichthys crocea TaxID=215358 RepID=A0A6G0HDV6_LARCR|nr:hypothetical protein D5F01_LYC24924 [Larimichthys crocea]
MKAMIRCPNTNCPAPPGEYLEKKGFGSYARQVCGMKYDYTLLTEKLTCPHCHKMMSQAHADNREDEEEDAHNAQQYTWLAYSPKILMNLAPAVRSMFPAILCGKRAVDRAVVILISDRLNAVSMSKVQRLLQQGHNEWYVERRTCTRLSLRVLRRAHLIMEIEKMPMYRHQLLSVTGEILCIDGTRKVLKKIYGDGQGTMQYVTSVLNEWGQFVTTVVVAAESEGCYGRMARGLIARFRRTNAPAPKVLYADNNCCRDSGSSFLENLFGDWVKRGTVVRLDIRHWLHRWDAAVIKQSHAKYGVIMSALAGAVLAYNKVDMMLLVQAVRSGNPELYARYSDKEMMAFLKPHQIRSYVRRITRGVVETALVIESIIAEFRGPAGLDIDGIHLFKSTEAVDAHWTTASKHLSCMQDPPGIQLYVSVKVVVLNGVRLNKYRCRRGSNSLEGLHAHLFNAIPSQRCGIMPFLDHVLEPNFAAPMPVPDVYEHPDEEELLGGVCQSNSFTARDYYVQKVEEEQSREEEELEESAEQEQGEDEEMADEGLGMSSESEEDPMHSICRKHAVLTQEEQVEEEDSPALQDVLMSQRHLHLPGIEEVEAGTALLLLELAATATST